MSAVLRLLRLQIDNKSDILKTATPKTMIPAIAKAVAALLLATLLALLVLPRVFILGFAINAELISLVLTVMQLISLAFAVGTVINTLYLCRDNEMLVCLPITPNQLFVSKLLMIYIIEFAVNAMISVPLFVGIGMSAYRGLGLAYYLSIPLMLLLLPVLPIIVAAFLSIPLMRLIRFLKKHTLLSILAVFALVASCLWGYLMLIGGVVGEFDVATDQLATVARIDAVIASVGASMPIYYPLARAMLSFSHWYYFAVFAFLLAVLSTVIFLITRYFFFKTAMSSLEKTVKPVRRESRFRQRSPFVSLLTKEFRCVFRSAADVFEYFLFTLLMPFIVFSYDRLLMEITVRQAGVNMIAGAHIMVVAILAMLSNISSASAISRDGANFYSSKIIPVDFYTQMLAKFSFNAIFTLGAVTVTALISMMFYHVWQVLLGSLAVAMASVGHIAYCIDSDIKSPTVCVQGDEASSTVSKTTKKALLSGLLIGFILGIIVILLSEAENAVLPYLLILALSLIFMIYRVYTLILRINLSYDKIEM